jgi:hypothetical protein
MMGRDRRYGRRANLKARVGVATAILVGGGAIAVAAVAATSHGSALAAQPAGFSRSGHESEWSQLNSAINEFGTSSQSSMDTLASMTGQSEQTFSQTTQHHTTLDEQRGIVVFATSKFLILKSHNGSLHLWLLSGKTKFANVSDSTTGAAAMTGSTTAANDAVSGDTTPATALLAGNPLAASQLLTPSSKPQTMSIHVPGTDLTVTVTITKNTAKVSQTATMPSDSNPFSDPSTTTQSAWTSASTSTTTNSVTRGDLAIVIGVRSHGLLHAKVVLYMPPSTSDASPSPSASPSASSSASPSPSPSPSASPTASEEPTPLVNL